MMCQTGIGSFAAVDVVDDVVAVVVSLAIAQCVRTIQFQP